MTEEIINGIPVLVGREGRPGRIYRTNPLPRKVADKTAGHLTRRQKDSLRELMRLGKQGRDITSPVVKREAALNAGYSKTYAPQVVDKLLGRKPIVKELEKMGVTDEMIAKVIKEGMTKPKNPKNIALKDYHAIHKFVQEANKLRDNYPAQKLETESKVIYIHLTTEDYKALDRYKKFKKDSND